MQTFGEVRLSAARNKKRGTVRLVFQHPENPAEEIKRGISGSRRFPAGKLLVGACRRRVRIGRRRGRRRCIFRFRSASGQKRGQSCHQQNFLHIYFPISFCATLPRRGPRGKRKILALPLGDFPDRLKTWFYRFYPLSPGNRVDNASPTRAHHSS